MNIRRRHPRERSVSPFESNLDIDDFDEDKEDENVHEDGEEIKDECKDSDEEFWENLEESEEAELKGVGPKPCQEEVDRHMATHLPF